ncbi:hypothetical protein Q5H93_03635 [Hymenobacter sp. ASUV-10]|uniref:Uncharacterized protein n=1 Tax=Hymenobacter aranciens TaxID=3063996 RepID=A0ABT9B6A8_9BACT|nr:hypothetical protein [Hymenobacter sp. ASUV-10]MDO7873811.1 hypothetical protein [Hymenobacter sp. ASUV-10]
MQHTFRFLAGLALAGLSFSAQAQTVGIGTTGDTNAALDISAGTGNNKGLLIPRMTQAQRLLVTTTTEGMLVYQTNGTQPGFWYYTNNAWVALPSGVASGAGWLRTGNSGTDPGPNPGVGDIVTPATNFIGTTDNKDLVLSTNNVERLRITTDGSLYSRSTYGLILNANDAPMITRGWDKFTSGSFNGLGRWGLFMRASQLTSGIPNDGGKSFGWVTWNANSTVASTLMTLTQSGNLGIGLNGDAASTRLSIIGTGTGNPNTTGAGQSGGHLARFRDNGNVGLDLGSSGSTTGLWLQSTNPTDLSTNYALRLNPNGGNVGVGTGTTAPNSTLSVGGTMSVATSLAIPGSPGGSNTSPTDLSTYRAGYLGLAPTAGNADFRLPDPTTCAGRIYYLRNNSGSQAAYLTLTNYAAGSKEIFAGSSSSPNASGYYTLPASGNGKTIIAISDGANWTIGQIN